MHAQSTPTTPGQPHHLGGRLATLATEAVNPALADIDARPTEDLVRTMASEDLLVPRAIAHAAPRIAEAIDAIAARMLDGGRLIYLGAGTAGRIGILDASECPPTFGTDPDLVVGLIAGGSLAVHTAVENAEDDTGAGVRDLEALHLTAADSVVGISASGRTPYVASALRYAAEAGALTVALACNARSEIGALADIALDIEVGPEFLAGSTRLKAGTAQKLVLNMISTITMVRLGKTYGNLMVDLQATNEKLRARSERTIMSATGAGPEAAARALTEAGGSVKEAILMLMLGLDSAAAAGLLAHHGGRLRDAVTSHDRT